MRNIFTLILFFALIVFIEPKVVRGQLSGNYTVGTLGGEDYTSLTNSGGIFDAINTNGVSGNITVEITSDLLTESGDTPIDEWLGGWTVNIVPQTPSLKTIVHNNCSNDLILLNKADNLIIDGRYAASGTNRYLNFISSCSNQSVIQLDGDCENVVIRNCIISSDNSLSSISTGGAIHVSKSQTNGSDSLEILYNLIEDYSAPIDLFDAVQINAPSVASGVLDGLKVTGNEFANVNGKGVYIIAQNGEVNSAEIARNSFYSNGTITGPGPGWAFALIQVESGGGHNIRANYMGGSGPLCSGSKMNVAMGGGTKSVIMVRMKEELPLSTTNNIDSNVFRNMNLIGSTANAMLVSLIRIEAGNCNVGVNNGNITGDTSIDASTATGASIVMTENYNSTSNYFRVVNSSSNGTINIENNIIGGILLENNNSSGIRSYLIYSDESSANINNNSIGGVNNNIVKKPDGYFRAIYSNTDNNPFSITGNTISGITTQSNFDSDFYGIRISSGSGTPTVSKNTISNITINNIANEPRVYAIRNENPNALLDTNIIENITISSSLSGTQFYGIHIDENSSNFTLQENRIENITLTNNSNTTTNAIGIYTDGSSSFTIQRNFLSDFTINSASNSSYFRGIHIHSAIQNSLTNNVLLIDNDSLSNDIYIYGIYDQSSSGTNNIWHNTVDIRGVLTGSRRSACYYRTNGATRNIQNNIFNNRRYGGSGGHYAMYHNSTSGTMTCNYNLLYNEYDMNKLVRYSSNRNFNSWQSQGFGTNSVNTAAVQELVNFSSGYQTTIMGNDIGNTTLGILIDHNKNSRPLNLGYDMGAFEIETSLLEKPLPIELLSFNAENEKTAIKTYWSTANEINNDYFTVLRSKNGYDFENIGIVIGAGNSNAILNYAFYDDHPYMGLSYYQLKQTDFNGTYSFSHIVPVYRNEFSIINIYPNPAADYIQLIIGSEKDDQVKIHAFNSLGKLVLNHSRQIQKGHSTIKINISHLASGNYSFVVTSSKGEHIEQEFIKK